MVEKKQRDRVGKRKRIVRNFPAMVFEEPYNFAQQMFEFGSGEPVRRLSFFDHIGRAPESSLSRILITSSNKYGLTKGGYNAEYLELTSDGLKAVGDNASQREKKRYQIDLAINSVEPFKLLYEKFLNNKLPARAALIDGIKEFGVTDDAAEEAVDTFIVNLQYVGLVQNLSGSERIVTLDHLLDSLPASAVYSDAAKASSLPLERNKTLITSGQADFETTCFYITPIGEEGSDTRAHSDLFLSSIVEPALEPLKMKVVRADRIHEAGTITKQIIEYIIKSRLVVADLSFHNPNVFYELAIRHVMGRPVVQIAREEDRIPFDLNQMRTIRINDSSIYSLVPKIEIYRSEIAAQARNALEGTSSHDNPIATYFPDIVKAD